VTAGANHGWRTDMEARMTNPVMILRGAAEAMEQLGAAARSAGVPESTLHLIEVRTSQINGCSVCLDMHSRELTASGEPDERVFMVAAWREAPYFSDAERAAPALSDAATRLADRADPIPEQVWEEATRHYDEAQLAGIVVAIAGINAWNRINAATRQVTGNWISRWIREPEPVARTA
jgi:AhpD family alkylhydroperoxidase